MHPFWYHSVKVFNGHGEFMGLTEEHLCTCDPVIAGVGDSSSGLSSQL